MKHYLRFSLTLLLLVLVGGVGFAQTTIWSEDWGSAKKDQKPSEVNYFYSEVGSGTKVYEQNLAGGTSPELLIAKSNGSWTVKITDLKNCTGELTLTYMCNNNLTVKANSNKLTPTTNGNSRSAKFNVSEDVKELTLVFTNTSTSKNVRIDDIVLTGLASGQTEKTKTTTTFGTAIDNQTFTLTEGDEFPQYIAHTTDASGNAVAGTIAYTSDNACVTVDANGQTAAGEGFGTAKITATFTPTEADKYEASSASYTITYNEKVAEGTIVFSGANGAFAKVDGYSSQNTTMKDVTFIDTNNKEYTFSTNGGKTGAKIQLVKNIGKIVSPVLSDLTNGYKVTVTYYQGGSKEITLSAGDLEATGIKKGTGNQTEGTGSIATLTVPSTDAFTITAGNATYISNITIEPRTFDYTWNDTEDNVILNEDNKTVKINRTVVKDEYNTICLPFDMNAEEIAAAFGEGTKVYEFGIAEENTLLFEDADGIETGSPYLLKPTETKNEIVYTGTIYGEALLKPATDGEYSFIGTFSPATLKTDGTNLFFVAGAKLAKPESDQNNANRLKGFRAYMEVPAASANALKVCIDGITASINDIKSDLTISDGKVYNLNGQYVGNSMQNLAKGVYVQNGKKYVVK